jgi:hypothetical protein
MTLATAIIYLNTLYNANSSTPTAGEEDYTVWTSLFNIAINTWENEEGMLWRELFVKLANAATGDKTTAASDYSYIVPTNFVFPASAYVWLGSGNTKTAYKVIKQEDLQLYENNSGKWCYFLMDGTPTLEFNPNLTISGGDTISYNYYKTASTLSTGTNSFEMADPMYAVYFALNELKKDEGDSTAGIIATQKMEAMKTHNTLTTWQQVDSLQSDTEEGFGV